MSAGVVDAQFHRAVDIVQSLPKGGPVQTSYEEKLGLYSLYKQATDGDISIPRPGMLDMLGRAKWDSWNKRKGLDKDEAKQEYVAALLKILKKHGDRPSASAHIQELEAFTAPFDQDPARPSSPASSSSSYHSSQASPPLSPPSNEPPDYVLYPPPDPSLPAPDVSPDFVPPSALTSSHRSLLNLAQQQQSSPQPPHALTDRSYTGTPIVGPAPGSRAHSLLGGRPGGGGGGGTSEPNLHPTRKDSVHSFRQQRGPPQGTATSALGLVPEQSRPFASSTRPFSPSIAQYPTPDLALGASPSPYLGLHPAYGAVPPRPASTSTFDQPPLPYTMAATLQQIQTSLTALHERLTALERTQAMILRRDERRRGWFWTSREEDELDEMEEEGDRVRWGNTATTTATTARIRRRRTGGVPLRMVWWLVGAVRRAMLDVGVGMMLLLIGAIIMGGGWRRARYTLSRLWLRGRRFITSNIQS